MTSKEFKQLLIDYEQNKLNAADSKLVEDWLALLENSGSPIEWDESELDTLFKGLPVHHRTKVLRWKPWMYAAALILVFIGFFALYQHNQKTNPLFDVAANKILPVRDVAVLTLESGELIYLDEAKAGVGMEDGKLRYSDGSLIDDALLASKNLTISTPQGKKYSITLHDGTKVWLNAASKLTYPLVFDDKERTVILQGEAYFEVAKSVKPFMVQTANQEVRVLGTHFNVAAYPENNQTMTSLLEGAVQVRNSFGDVKVLKPGQQSILSHDQRSIHLVSMDADAVLGWKNDLFAFQNSSLKEIFDEVERWYGVKVDINNWPNDRFYGEVQRDVPLSEVLKMVEMSSNLRFKVVSDGEERRLIML